MTEDFISEWTWRRRFIRFKIMFSFAFCRKKFCQGRKITKCRCTYTQKQRRNPHQRQFCLPSVSSHCWSWKWQQISQWMAVLWKWWEVKQSVKGSFLPKVLILHFGFYVIWHLDTHTSLPVCFALHKRRTKKTTGETQEWKTSTAFCHEVWSVTQHRESGRNDFIWRFIVPLESVLLFLH